MTLLQSLALKLVMLAVTAGILYWVLQQARDAELEQSVALPTTLQTAIPGADHAESEIELAATDLLAGNNAPAPVVSPATSGPVPSESRTVAVKTSAPERRPVTFPLDLNAARFEDFLELPGIGEKLAQRLMDYRKSHGGFRSVEDLREVWGIGEKRMERLRPLVTTAQAHD